MRAAQARDFDVVLVEALDRLSRDYADLGQIHKRLAFHGVEVWSVHQGGEVAGTVQLVMHGLVGQLQREDGAKKVRRGMEGRVKDGLHMGGRAYGYQPVPGRRGELEVVEHEAAVVRASSSATSPVAPLGPSRTS
jgi:DNA invertase Pin-like site-specific DNA recombinase